MNNLFIVSLVTGEEADDADLEAPKVYEPVETLDQLAEKLNSYMEQYNETVRGGKMDLVFFKVGEIKEIINSSKLSKQARFLRVCSTSLLKTLWEKEKLLIMSNFSFSHSILNPFGELSAIFTKFRIVVCKLI